MIEFDPAKAKANLAKHGIDFADAETVLYDPRAYTTSNVAHGEARAARRKEKEHYEA